MDHKTANATHAVERYLLNELTPAEREEFEQHFFICPECADAVRTGTILLENGREVAREQAKRPFVAPRTAKLKWMIPVAAAAVVLITITGYQNLIMIPKLKRAANAWESARALRPIVLHAKSRGSEQVVKLHSVLPVDLALDVPASRPAPTYFVEVRNRAGALVFSIPDAPVREGMIQISLPESKLAPGNYEILVRESSLQAGEVGRFDWQAEK